MRGYHEDKEWAWVDELLQNIHGGYFVKKMLNVPKFQWLQHIQTCQMLIRVDPGLVLSLQRRHYERGSVSNHRRLDCLLNRLCKRKSKKTSKLRVTGLCEGNPPVNGGFLSQRASNAENVSISWRHHVQSVYDMISYSVGWKFSEAISYSHSRECKSCQFVMLVYAHTILATSE